MTIKTGLNDRLRADKKIFWPLLITLSLIFAIQNLPYIFSTHNRTISALSILEVLAINAIAFGIIRHATIYRKDNTVKYIIIIIFIVFVSDIAEWVVYGGIVYYITGSISSSDLLYAFMIRGSSELWVLFSWATIYYVFMQSAERHVQAIALERANTLAHQAQLNMLRYQLNPHFLFNTLNSLSALVLHKRNQESESLLMKLSQFLRFTLDTKASQMITLQEEIFVQKQYLDIEKTRFQDRLRVQVDIEKGVKNACVPSLILQPLVENAIKHAIAWSTEGGRILICAYKENNALILVVEDDGPGVEDPALIFDSPSNGVGLSNIADRLRLLYGTKGTFTLETASTGGLKAIISIPLSFESTPS